MLLLREVSEDEAEEADEETEVAEEMPEEGMLEDCCNKGTDSIDRQY